MTVTPASIKEMFPEFSGKTDDFVTIFINSAKVLICEDMYGNRYDLALSYLTAHLMKISTNEGFEISSTKVGDLERTYNSQRNVISTGYETTTYGKQFLLIKESIINNKLRPIYGDPVFY